MRFPVFVLVKDCGEIRKFSSIDAMQHHLKAIDIENEEYTAWDADGTAIELGTQKPIWINMREKGSDLQSLISALHAFAASQGVVLKQQPTSAAEIEGLFDSIATNKRVNTKD